jgi:hypothetical protein
MTKSDLNIEGPISKVHLEVLLKSSHFYKPYSNSSMKSTFEKWQIHKSYSNPSFSPKIKDKKLP